MTEREISVVDAVQLLAHAGQIDAALAYANLAVHVSDLRAERRAAYAQKDAGMVAMFQKDIAKATQVIDALEIAMLTA